MTPDAQTLPATGPRRAQALRSAGWYALLTLLSVIVLFPIYVTIVRALSTPVAYANANSPLHPVAVQWDVFWRAATSKGLTRALTLSAVMTVVITVAQLVTSFLASITRKSDLTLPFS